MPKKRRSSHIPQQVTRKRRSIRRPDFAEAPVDTEEQPQFADPAGVSIPGFGGGGPVETRPQWRESQPRSANRRRLEQLRRSSSESTGLRALAGQLPTYERSFLVSEIRRIFITSGILLAIIIALALVMR